MARTELELLISVIDQATDELRTIAKNVEGVDTAGKKAEKGGLARFTEGMMDVKASLDIAKQALQGVGKMFEAVLDLARQAGQIERAERAFTNLSGSAEDAAANLDAMKRAAHGTLSEMDAMSSANKLMAMGLADNSEELDKVATMAIRLGQAFGRDATQAIDEFSLLLANQSVLRLDTFGISGARVRARIEELQKATKDLSREEAFMIATFEEGNKTMDRLGEYVEDSATSVERLESSWADLKNEWTLRVAPAAVNVSNALLLMLTRQKQLDAVLGEHEAEMTKVAASYEEYRKEMMRSYDVAGELDYQALQYGETLEDQAYKLGMATEAQWWANRALMDGVAAMDSWQRALEAEDSALGDVAAELDEATRRQIAMNRAFGDGTMDAEELRAKLEEAEGAFDDLGEAAEETKERIKTAFDAAIRALDGYGAANIRAQHATTLLKLASGELTIEEYKVQEASEEVIDQFMKGEITWQTAIGLIQSFGEEAGTAADYLRDEMIASLEGTRSAAEEAFDPVSALKSELGLLAQTPEIKPRFDFSALNDPLSKLREMRRIMNEIGGAQVKWGGIQVPEDMPLTEGPGGYVYEP